MNRFKLRGILILLVVIVGVLFALPTFVKPFVEELPEGWIGPKQEVRRGLDLQGGMHLVLKVETEKAVESRLASIAGDLKAQMVKGRVHYRSVKPLGAEGLRVIVREDADYDKLEDLVKGEYPTLVETKVSHADGAVSVRYEIKNEAAQRIRDNAVSQALETIRNRIDQFGVSEPSIIPEGKERIILQLPGVTDPERAKKLIGKTAVLEFKVVDESGSLNNALKGNVPAGSYVATMQEGHQPILLKRQAVLTGDRLEDAHVRFSRQNEPYVGISFDREGARIFERVTGENVGNRLAILLDGKVFSAPVIRDRIAGGKAIIEGRFTDDEASDLATILRAGSLPAPVTILEERTVGPSLGQDSIRMGFTSILIGGVLVIIFMVIYYRKSGLLADLALVCNVVLIMGVLAMFKAVLTLPGIAGIVLTIGMAVDANVIVYERIKEELRLGKTVKAAMEAGYKNALSTILDANVTTLIAALVLFQFGTGPVRGFAVTLSVGILASLFTVLVLCRWIMDWFVNSKKIQRISI